MSEPVEVRVPDIGDFSDVEIIEVLVAVGDEIAREDTLITLESDKAALDVPAPFAGVVSRLEVATGDRVSQDSLILLMTRNEEESADQPAAAPAATPEDPTPAPAAAAIGAGEYDGVVDVEADLVVLGSGPGGYTAAFRAADLERKVVLIERYPSLGGVCLNVGCIPSKALLHAARVIEEAESMREFGIDFPAPTIDTSKLRDWKSKVVGRLTGGLAAMARQRKVEVMQGVGRFLSPHHLEVTGDAGRQVIAFQQCIIAAGSQSSRLPFVPDDPRVLDSTSALELDDLPERMLVIGGGIIGLELATVYEALGVAVTIVELTDQLMPGTDRDLVRPLQKRIEQRYERIMLKTSVTGVTAVDGGLEVTFDGEQAPEPQVFGRVLVAVGRRPNGDRIGAEEAGVNVDTRGYIPVDRQMRTNVPHIFAIGDIVGQPMLAHKATHEAKVAAEVACGYKTSFDARVIPSVAYTDPEIAWVGMTEVEAKASGLKLGKGQFPWAASGRSLAINRDEGFTKILFDEDSGRIIGAGIVGTNAGDLIAELALAIELDCDASDIGLTIHPHPTLSETVGLAAEAFEGTLTDLYIPRKKKSRA